MWNDVIIGTGNKGHSACPVMGISGGMSISENSVSYWCSDVYLCLGMTIFKDTPEGAVLKDMIEGKVHIESIAEKLVQWLLSHLDADALKAAIDNAIERAFDRGRQDKAQQMRDVLGL